ncbi:MAG: dynamin family protein [Actinomycetota bacterium]
MTANAHLADRVLVLAEGLQSRLGGTPHRAEADAIVERLSGPLRVAIAGRVKAGKSTLLNALVGERLAPTDAGECTRLVSWYRRGAGYDVGAVLHDGTRRALPFNRHDGELSVQLDGLREADVASLDIRWPSRALAELTLIDTPGLASVNDENSRRTRDFLESDEHGPTDADAVVYLMRHLHRSDVAFLDAFMDRSVTAASPVNAVAVLSRADEIGAGRSDAMDSSRRIAVRYLSDPDVSRLVADVVPVTGLLAETGLTLVEQEAAALRTLAATPDEVLERMLLSADELRDPHASELTVDLRDQLLGRLGMFGIRVAVAEIRSGATTAAQLGPKLVEHSGLPELQRVIAEHFLPRARVLQARSALAAIRTLARHVGVHDPALASGIDRDAEQLEASAVEFGQIRAAHLVASGVVTVADRERYDLQRLLLSGPTPAALGLDESAGTDAVQAAALETVSHWRARAQDPFADPRMVEVAETAARTGESLYAAAMR